MGWKHLAIQESLKYNDIAVTDRLTRVLLGLDGGPGSGNFGHSGRPGKVGGSGKGGGSSFRTQASGGTYVGVQRAKAFNGIKKVAQRSESVTDFIDSMSSEQKDMVVNQYRECGTKERIGEYTERLWNLMHAQKPGKAVPFKMVDGKDITGSDLWDGKAYTEPVFGQVIDTPIEDIIVKQGFNGPPKVVSQKEFMKQLEEHPEMPALFRSYSALGEEAVQEYDDMLEDGEWYVDCENGGAQYGQGMYCAGVYDHDGGKQFPGAASEMEHYRVVSAKNCRGRWYPEMQEGEDCVKSDGKAFVFKRDKMKKAEKDVPVAEDVVAMVDEGWTMNTVKGTFMPVDPEDDDSGLEFTYYTDGLHVTVPSDKVKYWGPIEREETPPAANMSTRMMTLDPSAKIITYKDAQQIFDGKMTKAQRNDFYREKVADLEKELQEDDMTDDEKFIFAYSSKVPLGIETPEDHQKYLEISDRMDDARRKEIMEYGHEAGQNIFQQANDAEVALESKTRKVRQKCGDVGAYMAALGYDAINAEGHGDTRSYTIVLNRTKLIINQSRADIAS